MGVSSEKISTFIEIANYEGNIIEKRASDLFKLLLGIGKSEEGYLYLFLKFLRHPEVGKNFKIILISTIRHCKFSPHDIRNKAFIYVLVHEILNNVDLLCYRTLYLLKVIEHLVQKDRDSFENSITVTRKLELVFHASPLPTVKNYALEVLNELHENYQNHFDIFDSVKLVFSLFHYNVLNKNAANIYRSVLSKIDFDEFCETVWPFWEESFKSVLNEKEFHQSLLKYWIPITVQFFKDDLYHFMCSRETKPEFLTQVLYELRKKNLVTLDFILEQNYRNEKFMEVVCIFLNPRQKVPDETLQLILNYLNETQDVNFRIVELLLSHIFLYEHVQIDHFHDGFLRKLDGFIASNLHTNNGLNLCKVLLSIMKCSSKDLRLKYSVPKNFSYNRMENRYSAHLKNNNVLSMLNSQNNSIQTKLIKIFNEHTSISNTLQYLLGKEFNLFNDEELIINEKLITVHNLKKILAFHRIVLYKNQEFDKHYEIFEKKIECNLKCTKTDNIENLFEMLVNIEVLVMIYEMIPDREKERKIFAPSTLDFIERIIQEKEHENLDVRTRKVVEHLFCSILKLVEYSKSYRRLNSVSILNRLVFIIEKSNIRKVVTDAIKLTEIISQDMENSTDGVLKAKQQFLDELLLVICTGNYGDTKMRKHPRMRALLHSICKGSGERRHIYVEHAILKMQIDWEKADSSARVAILECLEILMSEPSFQSFNMKYSESLIRLCLDSFVTKMWNVKNASIQLVNVLMKKIFGIQQSEHVRLRSFQEFCSIFPKLADDFYEILSGKLDEKCILILQFISVSQIVKERDEKIPKFRILLQRILENDESPVVKFVPRAFVNICTEEKYGYYLNEIYHYIVENFHRKSSNIIVNHLILFKEIVERIASPNEYSKNIICSLNNFLKGKNFQYLDLMNIRCFSHGCTCSINEFSSIFYLINYIRHHSPSEFKNVFKFLLENEKRAFLLQVLLERSLSCEDYEVILDEIPFVQGAVRESLVETVLKCDYELDVQKIGQIISSNLNNVKFELLPKVLMKSHKIGSIERFLFLKLLMFVYLNDDENEDVHELTQKICKSNQSFFECVINYDFLNHYFEDDKTSLKFSKCVLKMIVQLEESSTFHTFYMDTYDKLQNYKKNVKTLIKSIEN